RRAALCNSTLAQTCIQPHGAHGLRRLRFDGGSPMEGKVIKLPQVLLTSVNFSQLTIVFNRMTAIDRKFQKPAVYSTPLCGLPGPSSG
ncbi:hypothetical protein, partial [Delftia acidovorans]|uniref:hypothetical protein n=2 Tax=Delftia acidovorans TaxID=80866 RepID=UPI0035A075E9